MKKESTLPDREPAARPIKTGFITEQVFSGADGEIHYSYYLPEGYDASKIYPMVMVMPGYDRMWFGESSSGSNLDWRGFLSWTELDEDIIVVSAQLTDWGEKSARQAIELTEYFLQIYSVDPNRVYAAGYSAGGETMSQAVSMRPGIHASRSLCRLPSRGLSVGWDLCPSGGKGRGRLHLHGGERRVLRFPKGKGGL